MKGKGGIPPIKWSMKVSTFRIERKRGENQNAREKGVHRQFLAAAPQAFESDATSHAEQERIAELERLVGKLTMALEIAKKAASLLDGIQGKNRR
jgi:hypothetical protein